MAAPSYTYTLTNGSTADASQVMQDFNDILNGITDGTKDITVNAVTANGTANFKGQVNLGDASADDVQFNGSLATSIPIKTTNSFDIGSSTLGLRALYFGQSSASRTAKILAATHSTASRIYTVPDSGADADFVTTQGNQTIAGTKTFSGSLAFTGTASSLILDTGFGLGSTNTSVRVFTNNTVVGSDLTYNASSTNGDSVTVNTAGIYAINYSDSNTAAIKNLGITKNSVQSPTALTKTNLLAFTAAPNNDFGNCSCVAALAANDVLRANTDATANMSTSARVMFRVTKIL